MPLNSFSGLVFDTSPKIRDISYYVNKGYLSMARILRFMEKMVARFPAGTFSRIDSVLTEGEDRASLVRSAVEREISRRRPAPPA
jgi:hypothetical protein